MTKKNGYYAYIPVNPNNKIYNYQYSIKTNSGEVIPPGNLNKLKRMGNADAIFIVSAMRPSEIKKGSKMSFDFLSLGFADAELVMLWDCLNQKVLKLPELNINLRKICEQASKELLLYCERQ